MSPRSPSALLALLREGRPLPRIFQALLPVALSRREGSSLPVLTSNPSHVCYTSFLWLYDFGEPPLPARRHLFTGSRGHNMRLIKCSYRLDSLLLVVVTLSSLCSYVIVASSSSFNREFSSRPALSSLSNNSSLCRCFPGDLCWPTATEWVEFNRTLGGNLVATVPIASACHQDAFALYDAEAWIILITSHLPQSWHHSLPIKVTIRFCLKVLAALLVRMFRMP